MLTRNSTTLKDSPEGELEAVTLYRLFTTAVEMSHCAMYST